MGKETQKINGIICEILILLLEKKATDIFIKITKSEMGTKIKISTQQVAFDEDTINRIDKLLNAKRNSEIEFPYWELIGKASNYSNLHVVGNMVDKVETHYHDDCFEIILYRKSI